MFTIARCPIFRIGSPNVMPRIALLDDEGRDPARARARLDGGEDDVVLGEPAVRDPGLLPAQAVHVPVLRGRGRDGGCVRAGARLGRCERRQRRPLACDRLEPAALLLLAAELEDRLGEEAAGGDEVADAGAAPAELLLDDAAGQAVRHAAAAVLLGEHERGQAEPGRLVPDLPGRLDVRLVDLGRDRPDLAIGELAADVPDLALLGRQPEGLGGDLVHGVNPRRCADGEAPRSRMTR